MRVVTGSCSIAPEHPVALAGNSHPTTTVSTSQQTIEANFVVLWPEGDSSPVVVVSFDLLYCGSALMEGIRQHLQSKVPGERVFLLASHTHYAPATDFGKPMLGVASQTYVDSISSRIAGLIDDALTGERERRTAFLSVGVGEAAHSVNRRKRRVLAAEGRSLRIRGSVMSPNRRGPTDETVTTAVLHDEANTPLALLWNYACHPVSLPDRLAIDPHFPGVVRSALRVATGNQALPVLFAQGFSGDTRPRAQSTLRPGNSGLRRLLLGAGFSDFTTRDYIRWSATLADQVVVAAAKAEPFPSAEPTVLSTVLAANTLVASQAPRDVTLRTLLMGNMALVSVPGEPVVEYALWLRHQYPNLTILPAGCADDVVGYLPTTHMVAEGGYEVNGFCERFGVTSLQPGVEFRLKEALNSILPK